MTKRGEPLPINQAMNRPRAKLGLDLSTWMAIVFVNVTVFLVGFRLLAILSFPAMAVAAWLVNAVRNADAFGTGLGVGYGPTRPR
jgi:hypothetical protein